MYLFLSLSLSLSVRVYMCAYGGRVRGGWVGMVWVWGNDEGCGFEGSEVMCVCVCVCVCVCPCVSMCMFVNVCP
jgi:hypothetical protein